MKIVAATKCEYTLIVWLCIRMRLATEDQKDPDAGLYAHVSAWNDLGMEVWYNAPIARQDEFISLPWMDFVEGQ
jgi:hypothetical protein